MLSWINITKLTFLEVFQGKTYKILLLGSFLAPLLGFLLSRLFLIDIGKVYMDGVIGITHVWAIIFILFIAAALLSKDIEQRISYFLLIQPATRTTYIYGRFTGLLAVFSLLMLVLMLESALFGYFYLEQKAELYQSGFIWLNMVEIIFLHSFQYIALLGFVFYIYSWASGISEIMLFSAAGILFSWLFPPILLAMQNPDVSGQVPVLIHQLLEFLYQLLPHLNGASIALELTHGDGVSESVFMIYVLEHVSYTAMFLMLSVWFFSRRDL